MDAILREAPEQFAEVNAILLGLSSAHHFLAVCSAVRESGVDDKLGRAMDSPLKPTPGTLFEVRAYFQHTVGLMMDLYHQEESTRTGLLRFIGDMMRAEFSLLLKGADVEELVRDRYDSYVKAYEPWSQGDVQAALVAGVRRLASFLEFSQHEQPVPEQPLMGDSVVKHYGLLMRLTAPGTSFMSYVSALRHLFGDCSDILAISADHCRALLEQGQLEAKDNP